MTYNGEMPLVLLKRLRQDVAYQTRKAKVYSFGNSTLCILHSTFYLHETVTICTWFNHMQHQKLYTVDLSPCCAVCKCVTYLLVDNRLRDARCYKPLSSTRGMYSGHCWCTTAPAGVTSQQLRPSHVAAQLAGASTREVSCRLTAL